VLSLVRAGKGAIGGEWRLEVCYQDNTRAVVVVLETTTMLMTRQ
jgi:hypothetical protein